MIHVHARWDDGTPTRDGTPANVALMAGRVPGFEDQVDDEGGRLATSNAELVERAARTGELAGRSIATPARAREILGPAA